MKSVFLRPTGRFNEAITATSPFRSDAGETLEPVFLSNRHTAGKSLFEGANPRNGLNLRQNAAAAVAEQATGYQILIDTLTFIKQQQSDQKFYELGNQGYTPSTFVPIAVGDGSWSDSILTRRTYQNTGDFEAGLVRQSSNNARSTNTEVSMDSVSVDTFIWTDGVQYSIPEIEQALVASNWDIISDKHRARMKKWQLGIQDIVFLGSRTGAMEGLLINTKTNVNTSLITGPINNLDAAGFKAFVQGLITAYYANTNSTVLPTRFVIPMSDFLGLQVMTPGTAGTFPVPMMTYLKQAFKEVCGDGFEILATPYGQADISNSKRGVNKFTYALYRHDVTGLRMDIPVDYTVGQPNSIDNFHFQDMAYGQLTGVGFYRPLETLLFQYNG